MTAFETRLKALQTAVEEYLSAQFSGPADYEILLEAMRYSLLSGGKRIRPVLCMAFCEACGGRAEDALTAGAAVEMVHTYSLIHDDLPCMDNDDYRRGRPTNHKVFGEDIATLAGDALLTAAFEYLAAMDAPPAQALRCVRILSAAAGEKGMVAGQVLDLAGETRHLSEAELRNVHRRKTGEMIRAACQIGTVLGGGDEAQIAAAGDFALHLGMAFQIRDDILDCVGTSQELGKPIGSDAENGKTTFVTLFGPEKSQTLVAQETALALEALDRGQFSDDGFIRALAQAMVSRRK